MAYPPFTPSEVAVIERFIAILEKRQKQVAKMTGIDGSFARALHDIARDIRAESTRHQHKALADETQRQAQDRLKPPAPPVA